MINEEGHIVREAKTECTEGAIERFLGGRPKESLNVVMEACGIWYGLYVYLSTLFLNYLSQLVVLNQQVLI